MTSAISTSPILRDLGQQAYVDVWHAMREFTDQRNADTADEIWLVEHPPVFTQGQAGKPEHILAAGDIPIVQTDRGGQVTYHGPGQLVAYVMLDIRRLGMNVRGLVSALENTIIDYLAHYNITAVARCDAPGVYVNDAKIAALGLRIRRGYSYHGLSFNINMDLQPFSQINPCGYAGLQATQLVDLGGPGDVAVVKQELMPRLIATLSLPS